MCLKRINDAPTGELACGESISNRQTALLKSCLLPVAAVEEALDDYQRFHDLIAADADDELALSEELAQRPSPPP